MRSAGRAPAARAASANRSAHSRRFAWLDASDEGPLHDDGVPVAVCERRPGDAGVPVILEAEAAKDDRPEIEPSSGRISERRDDARQVVRLREAVSDEEDAKRRLGRLGGGRRAARDGEREHDEEPGDERTHGRR